jgi:hypothetical protein
MLVLLPFGRALAQNPVVKSDAGDPLIVTASGAGPRLRFNAPAVSQIRLEVYHTNGRKLFDNELRGGNVLDWRLLDGQAQPLADDTYLCLVTVKSLSGKISQRIGSVTIEQGATKLQPAATSQMTPQQLEAIGPVEENAFFIQIETDAELTTTVLAHDGTDGQITRGRGALSFRLGDFYGGKDSEQMRLTAEGNLGIGINNPQARLDVAGRIRASEGIVFPDGSVQLSAATRTLGAASLRPGQSQSMTGQLGTQSLNISGTGTTGKISRWLDGPNGVLGDANLTEVSGAIGINGSPDTRFRLDVNGSTRIRGSNPGFNLEGLRPQGNIWLFQTVDDDGRFRLFGQDNINPGVERLTIKLDTGNLGIGVTTPTAKLDVGGAINASTQYNIGGSRVLSAVGTGNLFVGIGTGPAIPSGSQNTFIGNGVGANSITASSNTFVGAIAGELNVSGFSNTFLGAGAGADNTEGDDNTFVGTLAGSNNTAGDNNTFIGRNAANNNQTGFSNTIIGANATVGQNNLSYATAIGAEAIVSLSNSVVLGRPDGSDAVRIPGAVLIDGSLVVHTLGSAGSTQICLNAADRFAPCSSSLRYKTNVKTFLSGLDVVKRLRPITFNWKDGGLEDLGFGAEEVFQIEPRLTVFNRKGEIEGVKYNQLTTVLVNAVNEQQAQIEAQQQHIKQQSEEIRAQRKEIAALKKLICLDHPAASVCKP